MCDKFASTYMLSTLIDVTVSYFMLFHVELRHHLFGWCVAHQTQTVSAVGRSRHRLSQVHSAANAGCCCAM